MQIPFESYFCRLQGQIINYTMIWREPTSLNNASVTAHEKLKAS